MKEALFYTKSNEKLTCFLCPHECEISDGKFGICRVRKNENGTLLAKTYGNVCSLNFDPIEKKPLYHFFPGKTIFSVGGIGCNLRCKFCQNYEISQTGPEEYIGLTAATPEEIIKLASKREDNIGIAYTYNEPTVWFEYMLDIAELAMHNNLKNVMVTNGFINPKPLNILLEIIDAFNVDLKAFNEDFYKKQTSSQLKPVMENLKKIRKSGRHLEITNLVITNKNDNEKEFKQMVDWIEGELGPDTVFHISRYYPVFKMDEPQTPETTMLRFHDIASEKLTYVYLGNMKSNKGQNTYCKHCKQLVIERSGYTTTTPGLGEKGNCSHCNLKIVQS